MYAFETFDKYRLNYVILTVTSYCHTLALTPSLVRLSSIPGRLAGAA